MLVNNSIMALSVNFYLLIYSCVIMMLEANMKTKKEVYIAIFVAICMVLICVFIYFFSSRRNVNLLDVKVYKLYTLEDDEYEYRECFISTEDKAQIDKMLKNVIKLNESKQVSGSGINGDYKIVSGEDYIAFDKDNDGKVYDGTRNKVFNYQSDLYETIVKYCD